MEMEILKTAIDAIKGNYGEFSKGDTSEALRKAFIEMNGGSEKISPKTFVRGSALFALVEEIIPVIIEEGLKDDNPIFKLVEYRNIAAGDVNEFYTEGKAIFTVAEIANGVLGARRQRLADGQKITVNTSMKMVKVYENLGRLLAGRITFDKFVNGVADSFKKQILADAYAAVNGIASTTAGLNDNYVKSGSFDEDTLIDLISRVEAATGKTAIIYGTKAALRKVTTASVSDSAKEDMYSIGHYGKFNGTEMVMLKQALKPGTDTFILNDSKIFVVASDEAPVKVVNEGEGIMLEKQANETNDLTQEYVYGQAFGTGVICGDKIGVYTISANT